MGDDFHLKDSNISKNVPSIRKTIESKQQASSSFSKTPAPSHLKFNRGLKSPTRPAPTTGDKINVQTIRGGGKGAA